MIKFKRILGKTLQCILMVAPHIWLLSMMGFKYYLLCIAMLICFIVVLGALLYLIDWLKK